MTPQPADTPAYLLSADAALAAFGSDARRGLSDAEAAARRTRYGANELESEPPVPAWRKFLAQFQDVLVVLLLVATGISVAIWVYERDAVLPYEALAICAVVLLNAIMGYVQEARAEAAVAALRTMAAAQARVIRDGQPRSIPAIDVVPGDLLALEEGDTVPADARLVHTAALKTAEAALTGESLPVTKDTSAIEGDAGIGDRTNMVFSGTSVTYGRGRAIAVATGMRTEMGHIARMLQQVAPEVTPLQRELDRIGRMLGIVVSVIAVLMIATILLVENVRGVPAILDVLILGVALAVAAVPEGLPAVVTAVLSLGVQRMARRSAIVRHLRAVETLGSADVIASDKTGTLTRNEMTVRVVVTASGRTALDGASQDAGSGAPGSSPREELERALGVADRANNATVREEQGRMITVGDPTEGALVVAARRAGLDADALAARFHRVAEVPFSSERKLMSTVHTDRERDERLLVFTKGAPDILLARCTAEFVDGGERPLDERRRAEIFAANDDLAARALRTLAVAYRVLPRDAQPGSDVDERVERELVFAGLIGMIDPPRAEARDAVARARAAGIRPLMITGDHPKTAAVIARELGISSDLHVLTGADIENASDDALMTAARTISVFARVNPEHKLRIVRALQRQGAVVAMTGDGVNDAPALKTADIGVAMGISGTDVSKQAADMVLADDNFATIVAAVEEGRAIFANIRKFLRYLLSSNIGEVMTMFFGVLLADAIGLRAPGVDVVLPLAASQLLWINLVTDGAPALALGVEAADPGLMNVPPRPKSEGVITGRMWVGIFGIGLTMAVGTLLVLDGSLPGGFIEGTGDLAYAQTMAFTTLMMFQLFNVFNARSDETSAFSRLFTNGWLWGAIAVSLLLHVAVVYTPVLQDAFRTEALAASDWILCAATASSVVWVREVSKLLRRRVRG